MTCGTHVTPPELSKKFSRLSYSKRGLAYPLAPFNFDSEEWDIRHLGPPDKSWGYDGQGNIKALYFDKLPPWLKPLAKQYCQERSLQFKAESVKLDLFVITDYAKSNSNFVSLQQINSSSILQYRQRLQSLTIDSRNVRLSLLRIFLVWCAGKTNNPSLAFLINEGHYWTRERRIPNPVESEVMDEIFAHLGDLPSDLQLQFLLMHYAASRPNETYKLSFDCLELHKDARQTYYLLKLERSKVEDTHSLRLPNALVEMIRQQQQRVRQLDPDYPYLFYKISKARTWKSATAEEKIQSLHQGTIKQLKPPTTGDKSNALPMAIEWLIEAHEIRDSSGRLATFVAKSLRSTRATELSENGFSILFIHKWLGHKDPNTTFQSYAKVSTVEVKPVVAARMLGRQSPILPPPPDEIELVRRLSIDLESPGQAVIGEFIEQYPVTNSWNIAIVGRCLYDQPCLHLGQCLKCPNHILESNKISRAEEMISGLEQAAVRARQEGFDERLADDLEEQASITRAKLDTLKQ
ncbi:tyrosine-type recombinase/integrase [Oscillatoria sp. FACHB-1407]|uniref:tyrosine-type recombinase/integrase n=1 Tax=Oscillatoria sp. FACHB-1407 TaxID=2692847 RepID=UPI0016832C5A|nr:tyrosine-type recombinase/integrase [Oscillatoria sp. FACHB-1407]MBD2463914.1 tyrosine-type recombinase/integrase [Oscillatoria sp. FACHB-1407]